MNGNTPYAGAPGVVEAGQPAAADVTTDEARRLREAVAAIVSRTRSYLPEGYAVGSELSAGVHGVEATVAVRPPVGNPVSAGFAPEPADLADGVSPEERDEVARGLAAGAALQAMSAGDERPQVAR